MALVRLCPSVEVVDVDEAAMPCESTVSARIREAILQLRAERLLRRKFDYAWLKVAMDVTTLERWLRSISTIRHATPPSTCSVARRPTRLSADCPRNSPLRT